MFGLKFILISVFVLIVIVNCEPNPAALSPVVNPPKYDGNKINNANYPNLSDSKLTSTYPTQLNAAGNGINYQNQPKISEVVNSLYQKQGKYDVVDRNYNSYNPDVISELKNDVITLRENINLLVGMQSELISNLKDKVEENSKDDVKSVVYSSEPKETRNDYNGEKQQFTSENSAGYSSNAAHAGNGVYTPSGRTFNLFPRQEEKQVPYVYAQPVRVVEPAPIRVVESAPVRVVERAPIQIIKTVKQPTRRIILVPTQKSSGKKIEKQKSSGKVRKTGNTRNIMQVERSFNSLRNSLMSALWTGLLVIAIKVAPIIMIGLKLMIKSFLPIMGMTMFRPVGDREIVEDNDFDDDDFEEDFKAFDDIRDEEADSSTFEYDMSQPPQPYMKNGY